jgi:DNA-3-methyladenine glycosylase II
MDEGLRPVRYDVTLALKQLSTADAKLGALIERVGPFVLRVKSTHSPFEALLEAILYQQLHANAARAILGRLLALFGDLHPQPEQLLAVPDEMLRAAGLSQGKLLSLRDLAAKTLDGTVPSIGAIRRLPDQEIIDRLSHVRGIGTWTAEMLLIFRLGRPDVFPGTDYGIRKGYLLTFGRVPAGKPITLDMLPKAEQMQRRVNRWKPWRSVASWYLWRACELPPKSFTVEETGRVP